MYLLLVDNNYIPSREIKSLLVKNKINCEIVNCSSSGALLDIAGKILPELVIIDFDIFTDHSVNAVRDLRRLCPEAYIMAFVDHECYGVLHRAIEDGIDDYMIKPLQSEDVLLRIKMGLQRNSSEQVAKELKREEPFAAVELSVTSSLVTKAADLADSKILFAELDDLFDRRQAGTAEAEALGVTVTDTPETADSKDQDPVILNYKDTVETTEQILPEPFIDAQKLELKPLAETDYRLSGEAEALKLLWPEYDTGPEVPFTAPAVVMDATESAAITDDGIFEQNLRKQQDVDEPRVVSIESDDGLQLIDEAFFLVDGLKEELTLPSEPELPGNEADISTDRQYFDALLAEGPMGFDQESKQRESELLVTETADSEAAELAQTDNLAGGFDDRELFGVTKKDRPANSRNFEDLFSKTTERDRIKRKVPDGKAAHNNKKGKVEYLSHVKNTQTSALSGEPPVASASVKASSPKWLSRKIKTKETLPAEGEAKSERPVLRTAGNVLTALLLVVMLTLSFFLIQSQISGGSPAIAGYQMYVVLSGSMSPAFDTGSLVFVKPVEAQEIAADDIITFRSSADDASRLTTHRVVSVSEANGLSFVTRGDANAVNDPSPVPAENLVGRVAGSVPYIGYLFGFAQTRQGLITLIFIPGLFLILFELRRLFKSMVESKVEQLKRQVVVDVFSKPSTGRGLPDIDRLSESAGSGSVARKRETKDFSL